MSHVDFREGDPVVMVSRNGNLPGVVTRLLKTQIVVKPDDAGSERRFNRRDAERGHPVYEVTSSYWKATLHHRCMVPETVAEATRLREEANRIVAEADAARDAARKAANDAELQQWRARERAEELREQAAILERTPPKREAR